MILCQFRRTNVAIVSRACTMNAKPIKRKTEISQLNEWLKWKEKQFDEKSGW